MNHLHQPLDEVEMDKLLAFGDGLSEGRAMVASDELEATMLRVHRAVGMNPQNVSPMPRHLKTTMWEGLMNARSATVTGNHATTPSSARSRSASSSLPPALHFMSTVQRWQPAVSLTIVLALMFGLITVTYQRGLWDSAGYEPPLRSHSQALDDPDDASTLPQVPTQCEANGEVVPDQELIEQASEEWPAPHYTPATAVSQETGEAIQQTFLRYLRCEQEMFQNVTPTAGTAATPVVLSPEMQSYFSNRMRLDRLDRMSADLAPAQRQALERYRCLPRIDRIMANFPLPVNQPDDVAVLEVTVNNAPRYLAGIFAPSDVYQLPDGRFGVIVGSISSAALIDPTIATSNDSLGFLAFVEVDGRYYIDELFTLFSAFPVPSPNGRNGSIATNCP